MMSWYKYGFRGWSMLEALIEDAKHGHGEPTLILTCGWQLPLRPIPTYVISIAPYGAFGTAGNGSKIKPISLEAMYQRYLKGELNAKVN